jgi:hypothetical protein
MKTYKLSDMRGYTYNMRIYFGQGSQNATQMMTATHATVRNLFTRLGQVGHKDNFCSTNL